MMWRSDNILPFLLRQLLSSRTSLHLAPSIQLACPQARLPSSQNSLASSRAASVWGKEGAATPPSSQKSSLRLVFSTTSWRKCKTAGAGADAAPLPLLLPPATRAGSTAAAASVCCCCGCGDDERCSRSRMLPAEAAEPPLRPAAALVADATSASAVRRVTATVPKSTSGETTSGSCGPEAWPQLGGGAARAVLVPRPSTASRTSMCSSLLAGPPAANSLCSGAGTSTMLPRSAGGGAGGRECLLPPAATAGRYGAASEASSTSSSAAATTELASGAPVKSATATGHCCLLVWPAMSGLACRIQALAGSWDKSEEHIRQRLPSVLHMLQPAIWACAANPGLSSNCECNGTAAANDCHPFTHHQRTHLRRSAAGQVLLAKLFKHHSRCRRHLHCGRIRKLVAGGCGVFWPQLVWSPNRCQQGCAQHGRECTERLEWPSQILDLQVNERGCAL